MTPTVGRIVHYVAYVTLGGEYIAGAHRAAIITEVFTPTTVNLCVFNTTGLHYVFSRTLDESEQPQAGTWHWPERTE